VNIATTFRAPRSFSVVTDGRVAIEVSDDKGRIDLATAPDIDELITEALQTAESVVLDLGDVAFIDSSGLASLLQAHLNAEQAGGSLILRRLPRQVLDLFAVSGLDAVFSIEY
jgi:anti-sigma B factor antagonist